MQSSNNYFELIEQYKKNVNWLNKILKGSAGDTVVIDDVVKPSITKDIDDRFAAIMAMTQGRAAYQKKSHLPSSPPRGVLLAEVWKDPSFDNNGLYGWNGRAWEKSPYDTISLINQSLASSEGYLDGVISRWKYIGETSAKFYLDQPVYFSVKGSKGHRLPFPMEFKLDLLQVAYVDDDLRDESNQLQLQIVSRSFWDSLKPSPKRRVVASMEYNGMWSSPDLSVDSVEENMMSAISVGLQIKDINLVGAGGACEFSFGDGKSDVHNQAFMGALGSIPIINSFTTNGRFSLGQNEGLWFDFGKARTSSAITVEKTENIASSDNGNYSFIRGSKVLLLSFSTMGGVPVFHGKLGQQAAAVWSAQQKNKFLQSSLAQVQIPPTQSIRVTKIATGIKVKLPAYCYVAFHTNPEEPSKGARVMRTPAVDQEVDLGDNTLCYVDSRQLDADGYLIIQSSSVADYISDVSSLPYRKVMVWHTFSGYHGVASQSVEWLENKIDLSYYVSLVDAKYAASRDETTSSLFINVTTSDVWQAYTGSYGALSSFQWSDAILQEIADYGYIELKPEQGLIADFSELTSSGVRSIVKKVDHFYQNINLGKNDSGFLVLGFRRLNSKNAFYGSLAEKVDAYFNYHSGFYPQLDRVSFSQDSSIPNWDKATGQLTWSGNIIILSPWNDEKGILRPRIRLQPGTVNIPNDNYYVVWIDKRDLVSDEDSLGAPSSKIKIGRYYESNGWQGARDACIIGYCSFGNFTRVAFPPVKGTLEYPATDDIIANNGPDVVIDVIEPTSDLHQVRINIRDSGNQNGNYIQWRFERLTQLGLGKNSDVWHLQRAYVVSSDFVSIVKEVVTGGENETAVRETGKSDFVGGAAHGDEICKWVNMQLDGDEIDPSVAGRFYGKVFRVQQESQLYEEGTQAAVEWFKAWKSWEFSTDGVEITQRLEFQRDADIDSFYNCFLCIARNEDSNQNATTSMYGAQYPKYIKCDLISREHSPYKQNDVTLATAWGGGVHFKVEFLEGYGPQDPDHITYNPDQNYMFYQRACVGYNKMYFKQGFSHIKAGAATFTRYRYQITSSL